MYYTITLLVLLFGVLLYMAWRMDIALKKSKPVEFTESTGRIKPHILSVVAMVVAIIFGLLAVTGLILSDIEWLRKIGPIIITLAALFLFSRLLPPWNEICWNEKGVEGYYFSWLNPIIPKYRKVAWKDIHGVKISGGGTILLDENSRPLLAWRQAHLGHTFLNNHVAKKRPDLFYAPNYLEPIPRKK